MKLLFVSMIIILLILLFCVGISVRYRNQLKIISECRDKISKLQKNKDIGDELNKFPKYYINLNRSKERRDKFKMHMKEYGVTNHQRIRAFDGKEIEDTRHGMIDGYEYFNRDKSCTKSELAITMSHLIAMKKASDDGYQVAMIMEDDCELTLVPYWHKNINQIVSELPEEAEIFLMCNRKYRSVKKIEIEKVTKPAEFTGVCYLITEKGMNKIKKFFRTEEKKVSIDLDLKNIVFDQGFMREFNVYTYNISLFLLENYSSMSTHNQQRQEIPDINFESVQILKNEPFLIS